MSKRIPASAVTRVAQPALVAATCEADGQPITVVPLVDGDRIAGLEIRCRCGSHAVIDCVFDDEITPQSAMEPEPELAEATAAAPEPEPEADVQPEEAS